MKSINFLGDSVVGNLVEQGKRCCFGYSWKTGGLVKSAEDAISKAAQIEKVLDGIPDFARVFRKPVQGVVKKGLRSMIILLEMLPVVLNLKMHQYGRIN